MSSQLLSARFAAGGMHYNMLKSSYFDLSCSVYRAPIPPIHWTWGRAWHEQPSTSWKSSRLRIALALCTANASGNLGQSAAETWSQLFQASPSCCSKHFRNGKSQSDKWQLFPYLTVRPNCFNITPSQMLAHRGRRSGSVVAITAGCPWHCLKSKANTKERWPQTTKRGLRCHWWHHFISIWSSTWRACCVATFPQHIMRSFRHAGPPRAAFQRLEGCLLTTNGPKQTKQQGTVAGASFNLACASMHG